MKTLCLLLTTAMLFVSIARTEVIHFDDVNSSEALSGWIATQTRKGESKWTIGKKRTDIKVASAVLHADA